MAGDRIFPLVDRKTPLLDRVVDNRADNKSFAEAYSQALQLEGDVKEEFAGEVAEDFTASLSEELGLPEDAINGEVGEEVKHLLMDSSEEKILTDEALEQLNMTDSGVEDEEDEEDEDSEEADGDGNEDDSLFSG